MLHKNIRMIFRVSRQAAALLTLILAMTCFIAGCEPQEGTVKINTTAPKVTMEASPTQAPATEVKPSPTSTPSIDPNDWRVKFADKFTDGKVIQTDHSYQSANINVSITKHKDNGVVYFITDIYIAELKYFKTSFGDGTDKMGPRDYVYKALRKTDGVIAINADFSTGNYGLTIRNGKYYENKKSSRDLLAMYYDGTMKTFAAGYDWDQIEAQKPYQTFGYGPQLLGSDGCPMTTFNAVNPEMTHPRMAIGYYEPGHYCVVTVDGRQPGYSYPGYTLPQLAQFMSDLGCKTAFNLDGGGSSQLAFLGKEYNRPCPKTYRKVPDIIYITDKG